MNERSRRVVLLIDYDNLQICASRDTPGRDLQLPPVVQLAQRYGTVILARAYAEWNLSTERLAVYKAGIEPAFAPVLRTESDRSGKSLADTVMVAEGMDMLWTLSPDVVVLATSDKDLIPLVRVAKQRGAFVVVLGSDFTAIPLREMADEHLTYRQLITDATGRVATEAGPGRQPAALPEPSRRRSRDRNGRERAATPPAAAPAPGRAEREPSPSIPPAAEPVAPVTAATAGEGDAQVGGRRRRRRGSRRRLERQTATGEVAPAPEPSNGAAAPQPPAALSEITPTTSAIDVAQASSNTVEMAGEPVAVVPAESAAVVPGVPVAAEPAAPEAAEPATPEAVEAPPPPPRERRRRTRRATPAPAAEPSPPAAGPPSAAAEQAPEPPPAAEAPRQSADVAPAPEPASIDGEEPAAAPRTRRRRVASASRGRSRPT